MNDKIVVGLGEILWDIFPDRKVLGGAPANFAYHVSQFGFNGYAVSAIGGDLLGKEVLSSLEEKELNYLIDTTDYPTGTVQVKLDSRGIPSYTITENVAWDHIPFTPRIEILAKSTAAVCFGTLAQRNDHSRETIRKFIGTMPTDSLRIFDINLRGNYYDKQVIEESIKISNAMKINDEELVIVAEMFGLEGTEEEVCDRLRKDYHLDILILTKGTDGSYVFTDEGASFQPTPIVQVADTVGAGDSFTAAFTAAYLNGETIAAAHRLAVEVSAYVCQNHGAMPRLTDAHRKMFR